MKFSVIIQHIGFNICNTHRVINHTKNGFIVECKKCKSYQLSFEKKFLELTKKELNHFQKFLNKLDADYWEQVYYGCQVKQKIPIPTLQTDLQIMLTRSELIELRCLLGISKVDQNELLDSSKVDYTVVLN